MFYHLLYLLLIHTCPKCQILINCKVTNNNHELQNETMFYKNEAFHNNCLAEIYEQNKLADQPKSQPTNNPEQGSSLQHKPPVQQPTQSSNDHHLNNPLTSKPISSTPVSEEATNTNNDIDINNSNLSNNNNSNILINSSEQKPPLHQSSLPSHKQQSNQKLLQQS